MAVQIKCAGNQPLHSPPPPPPLPLLPFHPTSHNNRALFANLRSPLATGVGPRPRGGGDSVYHAKNIVTLTAIYNGFPRRELLIVSREAYALGARARARPPTSALRLI